MTLTDAHLRAAKPGQTLIEGNLVFRFRRDGKAGIRTLVRIAGTKRRVSLSLGRYPETSLAQARREAARAHGIAAKGTDPRHERKDRAEAEERTLGAALEAYLGACENRPRTILDKRKTLLPAFQLWVAKPIGSITKSDMIELLATYKDRPAARRKLASYADHFFKHCIELEWIDVNPLQNVRKPKPVPEKDRVLTEAEIKSLMTCEAQKKTHWLAIARLILLTGQRGGEISAMRISEIDFERREWRIPREVMKQGRAHVVPLSGQAFDIIQGEIAKRQRSGGDYVFGDTGAAPFSGRSKGQRMVLEATGTSQWSGHDLRRTAITTMQRLGVHREIRMAVTGHAQPRDAAAVYERHDFRQEAHHAVERLAQEIARISGQAEDARVIQFPGR
ncbi:MAG: tyrosine-type recombinase/integrase [Roseomonas sp.]|nr:tyrosine-type recombinase/integrase [Roseomonas sp.]